jgi:hypothetical protein
MKAEWEEIKLDNSHPAVAGLHVTLNRRGYIVMNRTTHKRLGMPKAVLLLYDRVNHRIGVRAANPGHRNAFKLGPKAHGAKIVRAYRLLAEKGIDLPDTVQFPDARIDDDEVLILDLRSARVSNRYLCNIDRAKPRRIDTMKTLDV